LQGEGGDSRMRGRENPETASRLQTIPESTRGLGMAANYITCPESASGLQETTWRSLPGDY